MQKNYRITSNLREVLKHPLGVLIPENKVSKHILSEFFDGSKITSTIGDRTTERLQQMGFQPDLEIVDLREQRSGRIAPKPLSNQLILSAKNDPGSISSDAINRIVESLSLIRQNQIAKVRLVIDGEEDLLVLPVVAYFPENTVVFYGQPNEGLVVVSSRASRERSCNIMSDLGIPLTR